MATTANMRRIRHLAEAVFILAFMVCKETRNVMTHMTNNKLERSPTPDLPVLILLILVLVITMHTTISQILYAGREALFEELGVQFPFSIRE